MNVKITGGKVRKRQKVVIYGPEGVGKSTLAANFPAPLFIDTEGSTGNLDVNRFEDKPTSWSMLLNYIEFVMRIEDLSGTGTINGVTKTPFLTATRIRGDLSKKFYLRSSGASSGNVQIIAQNCESCPFASCSF